MRVKGSEISRGWGCLLLGMIGLSGEILWAQGDEALLGRQGTREEREELRRVETEASLLEGFRFGEDRQHWNALEERMRNPLQREMVGRILSQVLSESENATLDARFLACRGLGRVGRDEQDLSMGYSGVESLLAVVRDERLSGEACLALQGKSSDRIDQVLREALPIVENQLKGQILNTLARRRDRAAVPVIVSLLKAVDEPSLQDQAVRALGQIGGADALATLRRLRVDERLESVKEHALLAAAARSMKASEADQRAGRRALQSLLASASQKTVKLGSLYEWASADAEQRVALAKKALSSRGGALLEGAPRVLALLETEEMAPLFGDYFESVSARAQTLLVELWRPDHGQVDKIRALSVDLKVEAMLRGAAQRAVDHRLRD